MAIYKFMIASNVINFILRFVEILKLNNHSLFTFNGNAGILTGI